MAESPGGMVLEKIHDLMESRVRCKRDRRAGMSSSCVCSGAIGPTPFYRAPVHDLDDETYCSGVLLETKCKGVTSCLLQPLHGSCQRAQSFRSPAAQRIKQSTWQGLYLTMSNHRFSRKLAECPCLQHIAACCKPKHGRKRLGRKIDKPGQALPLLNTGMLGPEPAARAALSFSIAANPSFYRKCKNSYMFLA